MIQRITFGSNYLFTNKSDNGRRNPSAIAANVVQTNLMYLKNEDTISITKKQDGYGIEVPNYMDKDIENSCLFSGLKYIKY